MRPILFNFWIFFILINHCRQQTIYYSHSSSKIIQFCISIVNKTKNPFIAFFFLFFVLCIIITPFF